MLIYLTDTLCGWCNVARPEIAKLVAEIDGKLEFRALHMRLFVDEYIPEIDERFLEKVQRVGFKVGPELTGQQFSTDYVNLIQQTDFHHDSHLSSLACAAADLLSNPITAFHYSERLQSLVFDQGKDPTQTRTALLAAQDFPKALKMADFETALDAPETHAHALSLAEQATNWHAKADVSGVPALLLLDQNSDTAQVLDPYRADKSLAAIQESIAI